LRVPAFDVPKNRRVAESGHYLEVADRNHDRLHVAVTGMVDGLAPIGAYRLRANPFDARSPSRSPNGLTGFCRAAGEKQTKSAFPCLARLSSNGVCAELAGLFAVSC
jgi:hypothetical protein